MRNTSPCVALQIISPRKWLNNDTVEPSLKDHPIGQKNVVSQDKWSLATGSVILKCRTFCQECVAFEDRWSLMGVVSQDRFHCTAMSISVVEIIVVCQEIFLVALWC